MRFTSFGIPALLAVALLGASTANAASYSFDFTANDDSYHVQGTLKTADVINSVSGYDILDISGTVTGNLGGTITSLVTNPNQPHTANYDADFTYDNNFFPSQEQKLTYGGILFMANGYAWNLWSNSPTDSALANISLGNEAHGTFNAVPVPEPESYAMLLAGLGVMGAVVRRRRKQST
jgi:hypothetical protein